VKIANKLVKDLRIKDRVGASIVAIIRNGKVISSVGPEDEILEGDTVVVIGKKERVAKLEEMISSRITLRMRIGKTNHKPRDAFQWSPLNSS